MRADMLGICWVQDGFYAVHLHKGKRIAAWTSESPVIGLKQFNFALADACKSLGFERGGDVSIVYESSQLSHPFLQTPPMNTRNMHDFLERRVKQEKTFPEDAAWSYTRTVTSRDGEGVLLHLLPLNFRDALIRICQEFFLYPVKLLPLSNAMAVYARELPVEDDVTLLIVALFDGQVEILAAQGDGAILFMRDLSYGWLGNEDRVNMEVDRSLLYVKQRFMNAVSQVWVTGLQSESVAQQLEGVVKVPCFASEDNHGTFDWAAVIGNCEANAFSNLVPRHILKKRLEQRIIRISAVLMVFLVMASGFIVWTVEKKVAAAGIRVANVQTKFNDMEREHQYLQGKIQDKNSLKLRLDHILKTSSHAAAPLWFTAYLSQILPAQLELTQEKIYWEKDSTWPEKHKLVFELRGFGPSGSALPMLSKTFQDSLEAAPLNAHITQAWRVYWLEQIQHGGTQEKAAKDFIIKGFVQ